MKKLILLFIFILFLNGIFAVCEEGQININIASLEELMEIEHIGEVRAEEIIKLRIEKLFESVDDLARVSGIATGGSRLSDIINKSLACVSEEIENIEEEEIKEENTQEDDKTIENSENDDSSNNQIQELSYNPKTPIQSEIIKLDALDTKDIKSENNTKEKDKSVYAKYGFTIFCILLGTLFILKKDKHKKNEFR